METKRTITVILIMVAVIVIWTPLTNIVYYKWLGYAPPKPPPATTLPATEPGTQPSDIASATTTQTPPTISAAPSSLRPVPATQPARTELGSPAVRDPQYRLAMNLNSVGAGVDSVILNQFKKSVSGVEPYEFQHPYETFEDTSRALATRAISIDDKTTGLASANWTLLESSPSTATYSLDIAGPGGPAARLVKSYTVFPASDEANGGGYEVLVRQSIRNLTDKAITAGLVFNGPTTPPRELDRGSDRMLMGGYINGQSVYVMQNFVEAYNAKQPTQDFTKADKGYPLLWAGTGSVYFDALLRLEPLDPKQAMTPEYLEKVQATSLNPNSEDSRLHAVNLTFQLAPTRIEAGGEFAFNTRAFFGPKQRSLLTNAYYSALPRGYNSTLVITQGICSICTFAWLINILVGMLKAFHWVFRDWGLAIIALVFVVRLLLHPITKKSQENMSHMSKFGPELEKLKQKHKDDQDALNKAMMQFYKEHGATPILGCLPMFLQMPIWIALWSALQSTFELRHAGFLQFGSLHLTWIKDLSQPDHLIALKHPIQLWFLTISGLNMLPILMGVVFFVQQKYFTPKPPTMTPEQEQQQKMMMWMTGLLFPLMLYAGPSGLNLYIFASTTFGIIESKRIRDHIKARDEAEKAGKVFVDPGKKFGGKRDGSKAGEKDKPQGRFAAWFAGIQEKAAHVQREQQRRRR